MQTVILLFDFFKLYFPNFIFVQVGTWINVHV